MSAFQNELCETPTTVYASAFPRGVTVQRHQFTALDRHVGTNKCVLPWAFLYKQTLQPAALRAALSATLDAFPTLAGRVRPEKPASLFARTTNWHLACCNAGVPFCVHSSSTSLAELLQSGDMSHRQGFTFPDAREPTLPAYMQRMDAVAVLSGDAPVLAVKLTQLAGGGSILAVTASHVVLDGRSYVRFMQHWAGCYNHVVAGTAAALTGDAAAAPAAGAPGSGSSSRPCYDKQVLIDLAAAAAAAADGKNAGAHSALAPTSAAAAAASSIVPAASSSLASQRMPPTSGVLRTAPAAAVKPAPLGWSTDAAAFLSTSSRGSTSAAAVGTQDSRSWCVDDATTPAGHATQPTPPRSTVTAAAPALWHAASKAPTQQPTDLETPAGAGPSDSSSTSCAPGPAGNQEAGHSALSSTCLATGQSRGAPSYALDNSSSTLPSHDVMAGLAAASGLSGRPGCASLTVLPLSYASSTAAEADESASLQPSISVTSTADTVVSSCFSAHAASFKEKPSWHGLQHTPPANHSSPATPLPSAAGTAALPPAAAAAAAEGSLSKQQQQHPAQQEHVQLQQSPATPTTAPAAAAAPHHLQKTIPKIEAPRHARAANLTTAKPFPYTPEPLYATRVLPNSWLGGFRAAAAAVAQVKAEERHIKQALLQRQGLPPSSKASLCGFGGGNRAGHHMLSASSSPGTTPNDTAKAVAGRAAGAAIVDGSNSRRVFNGGAKAAVDSSSLSTQLLHIPQATLQKLKATASLHCQEGQYISSNDAVSSLVWLLMCYLRKRPLPGQARPAALQDACLGLAFDLRTAAAAAAPTLGNNRLLEPSAASGVSVPAGIASHSSSSDSSKPPAAPAAVPAGPAASSSPQRSSSASASAGEASGSAWVDLAHLINMTQPQEAANMVPPQQFTPAATPVTTTATAHDVPEPPTAHSDQQQLQRQQGVVAAHSSPQQLSLDYFGSAAWSVHVRACTAHGEPAEDPSSRLPVAWHSGLNSVEWQLMCSDDALLAKSLAAGAVRIRGVLQAVRSDDMFPARMLQQVQDSCEAGFASQLAMGAGLVHRLDAFVTSWQFGIFDVAFGASSGSSRSTGEGRYQLPLAFQGLVHPVPPYHAVVLPAPPAAAAAAATRDAAAAEACGDARGGVLCCLTVPQCLLSSMVESPVLQRLVPGARWLSPCEA